ncbi:hypothetical protein TNCV_3701011 [Trichonephila clavipes]|nr:hypothetical protein TNCV_3701011 [Trichonephila clavipes]
MEHQPSVTASDLNYVRTKKEEDTYIFVSNIAEELEKSIDDFFAEREKNNQIKEDELKILLKSMCPCEKCRSWRIQQERHSKYTFKLFLEELVRLNSSKPLSKCEAVSSTNFTSEKSFENSKQDSKLSKRIPDQKPFNVLIDQLSSNELIGEKNLKISGKTCKGNYFNKGNAFKFQPLSVANAKKTVSSHSIHNENKGCTKCTT